MEQKLLLIFFIFLVIPIVHAQKIELNYPEYMEFNKEVEVGLKIINFSEDIYDIKIDIFDENDLRISKILDGTKWQSSYYYVDNIIDLDNTDSEDFKMIIDKEYEGNAEIIVSIRNSKGKVARFDNYSVKIIKGTAPEEEKPAEPVEKEKTQEGNLSEPVEKEKTQEGREPQIIEQQSNESEEERITGEVIKLAPRQGEKVYKAKGEYIKQYTIYAFLAFLVIFAILLIKKVKQ